MTTTRRQSRSRIATEWEPTRELLTAPHTADRLATPERYFRWPAAERRIRFYKVGRYIREDSRALDAFVGAGLVELREGSRR